MTFTQAAWTEDFVRWNIGDAAYDRIRAMGWRQSRKGLPCPYQPETPYAFAWEAGTERTEAVVE